ncbi:BCL2 like 16 [Boleophthalmus pectinirostris]|uniref:BCL2 like 16 n=1 Tax=Boleophthalmus pectinirostris TaxID=150288 RepID=UPI002430D1B8|nr:BCL2 like 16 [Boleophthalmus pectinirostris]
MCQSDAPDPTEGLSSPDPLVREAHLMAHDYIDYVTSGGADSTMGPAPTKCTAALRHAGDELLIRFPIFFRRWPRVFKDVKEETAIPTLMSILDQHFFPPTPGGRRRDLAWSAVLSVYVLAGQMAQHCHESGMERVLPQLKASVGAYVERVICPEIRDKGGWDGFVSRFGKKPGLESRLKAVCCWTLLALAVSILTYFLWKRLARPTPSGHM